MLTQLANDVALIEKLRAIGMVHNGDEVHIRAKGGRVSEVSIFKPSTPVARSSGPREGDDFLKGFGRGFLNAHPKPKAKAKESVTEAVAAPTCSM